ncbi:MAG: hypothetical protein JSR33_11890, partial [Proteobacteria bacterium]|nr:hypothetical protein [Pseudomonadota bacterium]
AGIRDSARRCYEFTKPTYRLLPGGDLLPWWMEYNADKNLLYSTIEVGKDGIGVVPSDLQHTRLEIQAEDEDGIILDKIILYIEPKLENKEGKHPKKEEKYKEKELEEEKTPHESKQEQTDDLELAILSNKSEAQSPTSVAKPLMGNKKPSETDLQETKKEPKKESPPISTRRTKVPSASNLLASDSPLRSGRGPTSSVMEGDSRKKQTGKETGSLNEDQIRQSRICC